MVGHNVAMVTYYVTKMMWSSMIRQFFDTTMVVSTD